MGNYPSGNTGNIRHIPVPTEIFRRSWYNNPRKGVDEETVLYADVLFLINWSMDFLTLYIAAKLTHAKSGMAAKTAASALGAAYGVAAVIWIRNSLLSLTGTVLASALMTRIAFGVPQSRKDFVRQCFVVWGSGSLLGGLMSMVMEMGTPVYTEGEGMPSYSKYFIITFAAALFFVRFFLHKSERRDAAVAVRLNGREISFRGLVDSGNLLREPLSGCPVIIVSYEVFEGEIPEEIRCFKGLNSESAGEIKLKIRLIPQKTVGGSGLLFGFVPDEVKIDGVRKNAVVALDGKGGKGSYGGYDGIVPMSLCG